jgi:hypothetical protein
MPLAEAHPRLYIWLVDETYIPKAWRMWVSIIVGGIETSWEDWKTFQTSSKSQQAMGHIDLKLENVQTGKSIEEINNGIDPFALYKFYTFIEKVEAFEK